MIAALIEKMFMDNTGTIIYPKLLYYIWGSITLKDP
jgi:hypothetical protein